MDAHRSDAATRRRHFRSWASEHRRAAWKRSPSSSRQSPPSPGWRLSSFSTRIPHLLAAIPSELGMAFVLIQHLDPTHPSRLVEALARKTRMPVHEIEGGMLIEPGHVYVIAPNIEIGLRRGAFVVHPRGHRPGKPAMPIDAFFCALAAERQSQAIGVVQKK